MFVAEVTNSHGVLWTLSLRLWITEASPHHLVKADALTVIHFSTAPFIHSCIAADQPVCRKHPQPYAQDASLASPGAGVT